MSDTFDVNSVKRYLRNTIAVQPSIVHSPSIAEDAHVINIETLPQSPNVLVIDLDNGMTIRLDIDLYPTEK